MNQHEDFKLRLDKLEEREEVLTTKNKDLECKINNICAASTTGDGDNGCDSGKIENIVDSVFNERSDRDRRKFNIICFNAPESKGESAQSRKESDVLTIQNIFYNILEVDREIEIMEPVRLGKKDLESGNNGKPRPLRFKVKDLESKNILLRAGKYLRNGEDSTLKNIYFTPDLTKSQRDEAYKLREEKRRRQDSGEMNLRIVRGKIVNKKH